MKTETLFLCVCGIIILIIIFVIVAINCVPSYPVKVSGLQDFLADISQIIKIGPQKRVEVSITNQKLRMFEGNKLVNEFSVSTGAKDTPTPMGSFKIYNKIALVHSKLEDCFLPFWAGFTQNGLYGFHEVPICKEGVRGLNQIGSPASIGCVRLSIQDAKTFYNWIEVGTPIKIENN